MIIILITELYISRKLYFLLLWPTINTFYTSQINVIKFTTQLAKKIFGGGVEPLEPSLYTCPTAGDIERVHNKSEIFVCMAHSCI